MGLKHFRELVGKSVVGSTGRVFGIIDDITLDTDSWKVASIAVKVRSQAVSELGLTKPLWKSARVEIPASVIGAARDVVILTVSLEQFAERLKTAVPEDAGSNATPDRAGPAPA